MKLDSPQAKTKIEIKRGRDIYYKNWITQEGFERWLSEYAKDEVLKHFGKWYLWAEKYAAAGSFQHLNLLMQIAREFMPRPVIDQSEHLHFTTEKREESVENIRKAVREGVV